MTEEKTDGTSQPPAATGNPQVVAVTQDDINKLKSLYDSRLAESQKALADASAKLATAQADIEALKGQAKPEDLKAMETARNMRAKEIAVEERERNLDVAEGLAEAKRLVGEAKAKWGVEISLDEISKLPKDKMAATVLDKVLAAPKSEPKPAPGKPRLADLPAQRTTKDGRPPQRTGVTDSGIEDYLRRQGRL